MSREPFEQPGFPDLADWRAQAGDEKRARGVAEQTHQQAKGRVIKIYGQETGKNKKNGRMSLG